MPQSVASVSTTKETVEAAALAVLSTASSFAEEETAVVLSTSSEIREATLRSCAYCGTQASLTELMDGGWISFNYDIIKNPYCMQVAGCRQRASMPPCAHRVEPAPIA